MKNFLIITILLFSFTFKVCQLEANPAGFFADEASVGLDALNILKTGRDRHGEFLPLFFRGFNFDNVSPYQVYLTVPAVALFGLSEKVVRVVPVFWSVAELFCFYLLLKEFLPASFALLGTFLLSISPWHFHLSRINVGDYYSWTLLTLLGYLFLVKALKQRKCSWFLLCALFLGLASYSYTPSRLTTPLLFGLTLLLVFLKKYFRVAVLMVFLYTLVLIPFLHFHLTNPRSFQRMKDTTGFDPTGGQVLGQPKGNFYRSFLTKYALHFSDTFLFQKGDADFPGQFIRRHSISGLGLLYPYQKWLILAGLGWLFFQILAKKDSRFVFILFLLLLFPLADSLTEEKTPFATRSYLGVFPFHLLIIFGVYAAYLLLRRFGKPLFAGLVIFSFISLSIISSGLSLFKHFQANPLSTSDYWGWQYGPKEIMTYFLRVENSYDELYMSGEYNAPEIFLKFYDLGGVCTGKCKIGDFFRNPEIVSSKRRQLFALSPEYLNNSSLGQRFSTMETVYYPNKQIAFLIGEVRL